MAATENALVSELRTGQARPADDPGRPSSLEREVMSANRLARRAGLGKDCARVPLQTAVTHPCYCVPPTLWGRAGQA